MICGLDEAGRGPLAGPVCAAAVILGKGFDIRILNDSKKISAEKREEARRLIYTGAAAWGIGWVSAVEIDEINILQASLLAMKRAYEQMLLQFNLPASAPKLMKNLNAIVDGLYTPDISIPCKALVKADAKIPEVMAASILAKTARDRMMERYSWLYPEYAYEKHKGYPTEEHRRLIKKYGPSPIQRMTFSVEKKEKDESDNQLFLNFTR
jgi:ribonuclease HII